MLHSKDLLLVLSLPLVLTGCGATSETKPTLSNGNLPQTTNPQIEILNDFQVEIKEDPVEQVDTIESTIESLELETEVNLEKVSRNEDSITPLLSGLFTYEINYDTPKGLTELTVSFTLRDNKITQVDLVGNPQHVTSLQYQKLIQNELGSLVVGKDYLSVGALPSKVAGSSLTPTAFNNALSQLQAEA